MKTIKYHRNDVEMIVECLNNDGVIATQTDTVMGLMIVSDSDQAIKKLVNVKMRPEEKLFPVMVSSVEMMETIVDLSDRDRRIIEQLLPGELTLILNQKSDSPLHLESPTVAVRIVNDEMLIQIVEQLGKPIFLTSANKSGEKTSMKAEEVLNIFEGEIEGVIMKDASGYQASTIVDLTQDEIRILREGKLTLEDIDKCVKENV